MKSLFFILSLMLTNTFTQAQDWLDTDLYPFESHFLAVEGGNMHYVDEGKGAVLLFVHGTPTWSFLYRDYIKEFSKTHRCIAIDHIGFGLSDKPKDFAGTPAKHAENLARLVEHLGIEKMTLVMHDFGGPIALSYAIQQAEVVEKIVLFNTWLWQTKEEKNAQKIDKILNSRLGDFVYLNTNFSPKVLLKKAFFDKKKLTKKIHQHYKKPFPNRASRYGLLKMAKALVGESDWYESQWQQINILKDKPLLIIWGKEDAFITEKYLKKWQTAFPQANSVILPVGHFVMEEQPSEVMAAMKGFLLP